MRTTVRRWALGVGLAVVVLLLGVALTPRLSAFNFRVITPGTAYRTNAPSPAGFERLINAYGIRTVLDFGPEQESEPLRLLADRHGARFVSLPLRSMTLPRRSQLLELLDLLEHAEPPLLLMDGFGAYKVGLASAFLGIMRLGQDLPTAQRAFSLRYGFVPYGPFTEVTHAFDLYKDWLARHHLPTTKETLIRWAREGYAPYGYGALIRPVRIPEEARPAERLRLTVEVENVGDRTWPRRTDWDSAIKLGLRTALAGGPTVQAFRGDILPHDVPPKGKALLALDFVAPGREGVYELRLDLVEEHRSWFSHWGFPPLTSPLRVR